MAEGSNGDLQAWQGPPLPQHGFGADEPVSQPGAARVSYIRPPTLVLDATRKAESMSDEASSAKKVRVEDQNEYMNEKTSTYSLRDEEEEDIEIECDEEADPFTLVTYKKRRFEGIPVVFQPIDETKTFWRVNPNVVASEIVTLAKEKVSSFRVNQDGSFSVTVSSLASAKSLLSCVQVAGLLVKPFIPESYIRNVGKIRHVPLQYTEEQLTEYLREAGVTSARRQTRYIRQEDGTVESRPVRSVILQFRNDRPIPERVYLGFTSHPVEEYLGPARRCYNCQRFGHLAKNCRGTRRCKICAEDHDHKDCKSIRQPKCANCNGPHTASFSGCPQNKAAALQHQHDIIYGRTQQRGAPEPNKNTMKPAQPPRPQVPKHQDASMTYAKVARGPQNRGQSFGTSPSQQQVRQEPQEGPRQKNNPVTNIRQNTSTPQPVSVTKQGTPSASIAELVIPMLFSALKAILVAIPQANNLPEVKAVLSMEQVILQNATSATAQTRHE